MKPETRKDLSRRSFQLKSQLYATLTTGEVVHGWDKHYKTVIQAIHAGNLVARKAGKTWVISRRSVYQWWGKPVVAREFLDEE
jgi:hypothetical protein